MLDVEWTGNVKPQYLTDFETQARRLRYRAIGRAAYEDRISSILLAHHCDDQAETMLMRLAMQRKPRALLEAVRDIPECFGIYGVNKSGSPIRHYTENSTKKDSSMDFEGGGMKLIRPLLQYGKERLQATCLHMGIEWFHDYTNDNQSLTLRNASRYLLSSNTLPAALQKENLLSLQSHVIEEKGQQELRIDALFAKLKLNFMLQSGVVRVVLPKLFSALYDAQETPSMDTMRYEGAMLLKRIANLVTPYPSIDLRTLASNLGCVFSDLGVVRARPRGQERASTTFTADGVMFYEDYRPMSGEFSHLPLRRVNETVWVLARQPFGRHQPLPLDAILEFPTYKAHNDDIEVSDVCTKGYGSSPFYLWDGRYWIRVENHTKKPIMCRPLTEKDIPAVNSVLQGNSSVHKLIKRAAPGPLKFVLPILADTEGTVHQLPSLYLNLSKECNDGLVRSEIRYKNIELGFREPLQAFDSPQ